MKNETQPNFETIQKWRGIVQNAASFEAAVEALKTAGLTNDARAIKFAVKEGGALYNGWLSTRN